MATLNVSATTIWNRLVLFAVAASIPRWANSSNVFYRNKCRSMFLNALPFHHVQFLDMLGVMFVMILVDSG